MKKILLALTIIGICLMGRDAFAIIGIDNYTVLMLHCNGVDGSTAFVDSSFSNQTVTANGNAQIDTAQSKFGGASALFDGNGDYLILNDSEDWNFGSGDFTVDFWVRFNATSGTQFFVGQYENNVKYDSFFFEMSFPESVFYVFGSNYESFTWTWSISAGTWYHVAAVRSGNNMTVYKNGVPTATRSMGVTTLNNSIAHLWIGAWRGAVDVVERDCLNGWLDELRISKGIARWTSDFTPPTSEYESSQNVIPEPSSLLLLSFGLLGIPFFRKKQHS